MTPKEGQAQELAAGLPELRVRRLEAGASLQRTVSVPSLTSPAETRG